MNTLEPPEALALPPISVALCTYNGARFIVEQMRSICGQSLPPDEIVLSDDGSIDDTVTLAQGVVAEHCLAHPDCRIGLRCIVNDAPLGVTRNFQQAIGLCSHELIALSDQDDVWHRNKLSSMVQRFAAEPALTLLHTDADLVDAAGNPLGLSLFRALRVTRTELARVAQGRAFEVLLHRNLVTGATAMFRRDLCRAALPIPVEWLHDEWLGIVAAAAGHVDLLPRPLVDYRQHGGNQVGARREHWLELVAKALAPRGDTHAMRAHKASLLLERFVALGDAVPTGRLDRVHGKLVHQRFRAALPAARWQRLVPVLREAATGRYGLYGRGWRGVVRDLLEAV